MLTPLFSAAAMDPQRGDRELQLLLTPTTTPVQPALHAPRPPPASSPSDHHPQLDLSLSIRIGPPTTTTTARAAEAAPGAAAADHHFHQQQSSKKVAAPAGAEDVAALKRQTAEQARIASAERAYAERVMELARRELELAEREFARARAIWDRARGEAEKVERVKAMAARRIAAGSAAAAALEITCHACMQRFHP